jgi:hypothetical protein
MKNLNEMNSKELKGMAKDLKVKNWWNLNKATLITEIELLQINEVEVKEVEVPKLVLLPKIEQTLALPKGQLIYKGKKGITNFQMIPAMKENIDNKDNLMELYNIKPEVFKSSVKYLPDHMKLIGQAFVNQFDPNFKVKTGKKIAI